MTPGKCTRCFAKFDPHDGGLPNHYEFAGAFPAKYLTVTAPCPSCRTNHVLALNTLRPNTSSFWAVSQEVMTEGKECMTVGGAAGIIDGSKPLYICWFWHPLYDDEVFGSCMVEAVKTDPIFRDTSVHSLLLVDSTHIVPEVFAVLADQFDHVAMVSPRVLDGAGGPYPSLRAERSIARTWSSCNLQAVKHYWPAATLNPKDYVPLMDNASLVRTWANYARNNLSVSDSQE